VVTLAVTKEIKSLGIDTVSTALIFELLLMFSLIKSGWGVSVSLKCLGGKDSDSTLDKFFFV